MPGEGAAREIGGNGKVGLVGDVLMTSGDGRLDWGAKWRLWAWRWGECGCVGREGSWKSHLV